jgi:hypothetical protein
VPLLLVPLLLVALPFVVPPLLLVAGCWPSDPDIALTVLVTALLIVEATPLMAVLIGLLVGLPV